MRTRSDIAVINTLCVATTTSSGDTYSFAQGQRRRLQLLLVSAQCRPAGAYQTTQLLPVCSEDLHQLRLTTGCEQSRKTLTRSTAPGHLRPAGLRIVQAQEDQERRSDFLLGLMLSLKIALVNQARGRSRRAHEAGTHVSAVYMCSVSQREWRLSCSAAAEKTAQVENRVAAYPMTGSAKCGKASTSLL